MIGALITKKNFNFFAVLIVFYIGFGCTNARTHKEGAPLHHLENRFQNINGLRSAPSLTPKFIFQRIWGSAFHPEVPNDHVISEGLALKELIKLKKHNTITWLGHASFILRLDGTTILTDPFLTNRASPFSLIGGVTRFVPPAISIEKLPTVDVIIISHDHYDHLDIKTISKLKNKKNIHVFVPLGLKAVFIENGYKHVHELDWNEHKTINDIKITSTFSVHYSGRGLFDRNQALWASWIIKTKSRQYYFSGDTAYTPEFKKIGKEFKYFDLAIIPIGAYSPRKMMKPSHVNPKEAIRMVLDLNAKKLVASHWGTIELSNEPHFEPPILLKEAAQEYKLDPDNVWVFKVGETRILK